MNKTPIEWTDFTLNPFRFRNLETGKVGHHCEKISPGCKLCYSSTMQAGPYLSGLTFIAENKPKGEFFLDEGALQQVLRRKKPCKVFWCDMTDMFLADYPDEWIDRCFAVMALTPHLTHQVLTKRADRMQRYLSEFKPSPSWDGFITRGGVPHEESPEGAPIFSPHRWPLPNVHLGVSVEDQQRYRERVSLLRETPAALRWLSIEPLLEDLGTINLAGIAWAVVGGESGPGARPFDIAWARSVVAQCKAAQVPVFMKQLGAKPVHNHGNASFGNGLSWIKLNDRKGGDPKEWPSDLIIREIPKC